MTNSNANNTDKIIELSTLWLEPRGRARRSRIYHKVVTSKQAWFLKICILWG